MNQPDYNRLNSSTHRTRLFRALERSRYMMRELRERRTKLIRDYCGNQYGRSDYQPDQYINLTQQTAEIYTMALAANLPRVLVNTDFVELMPTASRIQMAINAMIKEIQLQETLATCVLDAFFSFGMAKVFLADSGYVEIEGDLAVDPGQPYVKRCSPDDVIWDAYASDWRQIQFCSDSYRIDFEDLKDTDLFDKKVVSKLKPTSKYLGEDRADSITGGPELGDFDEYRPMIDVIDVWLPRSGEIVTWALEASGEAWRIHDSKPLSRREFDGPENGPYYRLGLGSVPDNIAPLSPAANLKLLADLANNLMRKLARQARRQKEVNLYHGAAEEDARRIKKSVDGEWVKSMDPDRVRTITQGGVDQGNLAFEIHVIDIFDRMAGNLKTMGGLGTSADTLGQEQMIGAQVGRSEASLREKVNNWSGGICGALGHLLYHDPLAMYQGEIEIPGTDIKVADQWTPEMREGDFWQYNFSIEPYSMAYQSPGQRMKQVQELVMGTWLQLLQLPQMQEIGGTIDVRELLDMQAELLNLPRLRRVIRFDGPGMIQREPQGEPPRQAAHTVRENVRRNVPTGGTAENRNNVLMQTLLGGGQANQDQVASLAR